MGISNGTLVSGLLFSDGHREPRDIYRRLSVPVPKPLHAFTPPHHLDIRNTRGCRVAVKAIRRFDVSPGHHRDRDLSRAPAVIN